MNELVKAEETPSQLIALALEQKADPDTLSKLLDLHERWTAAQARQAYVRAMTAFKQEAPAVLKKGDSVDFTTQKGRTAYNYANLGSIIQEITALLSKHDLAVSWQTAQDDRQGVIVTCHVTHSAGHRESTTLAGPSDDSGNKNRIQAVGSTVTYLQRYTLLAILGLATGDDDDGQGGAATTTTRPHIAKPQAKAEHQGDTKKLTEAHNKLLTLMTAECAGDKEKMTALLVELTTWEKDGKRHEGKNSLYDISEKMAQVAHGKLSDRIKKGLPDACTGNPDSCEHSVWEDDKPLCGIKDPGDRGVCKFEKKA